MGSSAIVRFMEIDRTSLRARLDAAEAQGLLTPRERELVLAMFETDFPYAEALARAESVHLHVRVDDVASIRAALAPLGSPENEKDGYLKLRSPDGVHLIVSSIDVAEDDRVPALARRARPHLDHVGIDMRDDSAPARAVFDAVPARARSESWRHAHQGGGGHAVSCCHTSVAEKHWVYPPARAKAQTIVEIALGPLQIGDGMGSDLRPLDPDLAAQHGVAPACCAPAETARPISLGRKRA